MSIELNKELKCKICGQVVKSEDFNRETTDEKKAVYHSSKGTVHWRHRGVPKWYTSLIQKENGQLVNSMLKIFKKKI